MATDFTARGDIATAAFVPEWNLERRFARHGESDGTISETWMSNVV
jgi:hypothetical protein